MNFNQFQRELQKHGIDEHNAFMLTLVYEQVTEIGRRLDDCASVLLALAKTVEGLTGLNEQMAERVKRFERGGRPDGIDVFSVRSDGDDK